MTNKVSTTFTVATGYIYFFKKSFTGRSINIDIKQKEETRLVYVQEQS